MENILIEFISETKNVADKLHQLLRTNNYVSCLSDGLVNKDNLPSLVIAIFSKNVDTNQKFSKNLATFYDNDVVVIPFVTYNMYNSIAQKFFLDEHYWIDNFEASFNESSENLIDLLNNNFSQLIDKERIKREKELKNQKIKNVSKKNNNNKASSNSNNDNLYKNLTYLLGAVVVILLAIIMFSNKNNPNVNSNSQGLAPLAIDSKIRNSEALIIGHWKMTNYVDNQYRANKQDSINIQQAIQQLISVAELSFSRDRKFTRKGFTPNLETGYWEYDPQTKYLKLQPEGGDAYDQVTIQDVNETTLIIVVSESVNNSDIITKMTFNRVN
ncbi:MAG: hypothetical protein MJ211_01950 [Bacteroidales bacterium]|nr:hypothetical protein [Bacteroidales bacterium]